MELCLEYYIVQVWGRMKVKLKGSINLKDTVLRIHNSQEKLIKVNSLIFSVCVCVCVNKFDILSTCVLKTLLITF